MREIKLSLKCFMPLILFYSADQGPFKTIPNSNDGTHPCLIPVLQSECV